jgi:hypothetical protein
MSTIPVEDRLVAIRRLKTDADNTKKESYVLNLALQSVVMNIQPASAEDTVLIDGVFAKTYRAFTTESGIKTGDHLTVSGTGNQYVVKGVQDWDFDPIPHYECLLVDMEND